MFIVCLFAGYFYLEERADKLIRKETEAQKALVTIQGVYTKTACPPDFPLATIIRNDSNRIVDKVNFTINVFRPDRSTDIGYFNFRSNDQILDPGEQVSVCYSYDLADGYDQMEYDPATLRYVFEKMSVQFRE